MDICSESCSYYKKGREDVELPSPFPEQQQSPITPANTGKQPISVTVIDEHQKYSFKPTEPGVLASKPGFPKENRQLHGEYSHNKNTCLNDRMLNTGQGQFIPKPKIELQAFEGDNPRGWIRKCEIFFSIFAIPEQNKLQIASMYLIGGAETWYDGYAMQKTKLTWREFISDLCHRFSDKLHTDVIDEFNKLVQKTSVEEYQTKFEELQPLMLQINPSLDEEYFVSSFISGLKDELKHRVKVHEPRTVTDAFRKAMLYELSLEIDAKRTKTPPYKSMTTPAFLSNLKPLTPATISPVKPSPPLPLPKQTLQEYRRAHNLCFKCGDKFQPGHQCKMKQLNSMEEMEEDQAGFLPEVIHHSEPVLEDQLQEKDPEISINALTGNTGHSTLRIQGTIKGRSLSILVDTGSTHSFLNPIWAKEGLEIIATTPLLIIVANGEKLESNAMCKQLTWMIQGYSFNHDFRILLMGGSDMVLGVDWMRKYNPITMDFNSMTMSFMKDDNSILLKGGHPDYSLRMISAEKLQKISDKNP
ncbi:hypothetical protein GQ457_01G015560 [Hibiscus cannabinus]